MNKTIDDTLPKREDALLSFIIQHKTDHDGVAPAIRDMMAATDINSSSMIVYYLGRLEKRGLIERSEHGEARHIRVVGGEWKMRG